MLEDLTGGFNYGSGTVDARAAAALGDPAAGRPPHALAALPDRRQDPPRRRGDHLHPAARRSTRSPPAPWAPCCPRPTPPQIIAGDRRRLRRHARPDLPAAQRPGAQAPDRRDARGPGPGVRRLGALGARATTSSARRSSTATSPSTSSRARSSSGPAIRETDGGWTQYGAVPPKGAVLRFTRYRHGGGRTGNVTAGTLTVLKSTIAGVDTVTNPTPGRRRRRRRAARARARARVDGDPQPLPRRHRGGLRVPRRRGQPPRVARAVCIPPREGGAVPLHIVPRVYPADRRLAYDELVPDEALMTEVAEYLDERRLIGTTVQLLPCRFRGLSVVVNLQASPLADTARVEEDVAHALYTYLNPLVGGNATGPGPGWSFGRALNQGELYGIVHAVDGVEFVKILRIYETNLADGRAVVQARRHAHRARARRADGLRPAHRQGHAPRGLRAGVGHGERRERGRRRVQDLHGRRLRHHDGAAVGGPAGRRRRSPPAAPTCAAACRPSTRRATSGCASSAASRRCWIRSWPCSTRSRRTSIPTTRRATCSTCWRPGSGVDLDESQDDPPPARDGPPRRRPRPQARHASAGMELALELAFPDVPLRVEDQGGVRWSLDQHPVERASAVVRRLLRQAGRDDVQAGHRPLHRAAQAGRNFLPPAREGTEEERHVMRTCQSCGLENPPDRDFCECGEYLRWEPTGYVQAITPEMAAEAAAEAAAPAQDRPPHPRRPRPRRHAAGRPAAGSRGAAAARRAARRHAAPGGRPGPRPRPAATGMAAL